MHDPEMTAKEAEARLLALLASLRVPLPGIAEQTPEQKEGGRTTARAVAAASRVLHQRFHGRGENETPERYVEATRPRRSNNPG